MACLDGHSHDPEADSRKGADLRAASATSSRRRPRHVLANAALALSYFGEDIGAMMALVDRALALNPSFARGWHANGTSGGAGQPDIAIEHVEASLRLSPRARSGWAFFVIGGAHFLSRRFDEALPKLLLAIQEDPSSVGISPSRRLLRPYGAARRRPRNHHKTTHYRAPCNAERQLPAEPRAPRAFPVGPAARCWRDDMTATRRLAAILAADVAGYSRLIGVDEEGTLDRLKAIRAEVIDPKISEHRGRIVKTTGDGMLVEFASVVDALRCATAWQVGRAERNAGTCHDDNRIEFRIGINVGDVVVEGDDIFGDGVNVAARLEGLAEPGGICVSARVQEDAAGRLDSPSMIWASRASRTSLDRCGSTGFVSCGGKPPTESHRPRPRTRSRPAGQAVDRGSAIPEHEQRPGAGILRGRDGRGNHHRIEPHPVVLRHRPEFDLHLQRPAVDVKQVGRETWGSVMSLKAACAKAGNRVRITVQLVEAGTGNHAVGRAVTTATSRTSSRSKTRSRRRCRCDRTTASRVRKIFAAKANRRKAWTLGSVISALSLIGQGTRDENTEAEALCRRAIAIAPGYGRAHSLLAWRYCAVLRGRATW